jgi:hypothetical protein
MNQHSPELQKNRQTVLSMTESIRRDYRIQNIEALVVNVEDNDSTSDSDRGKNWQKQIY